MTVTGTENLMMAAALANGTTTLRNVAREPEIVDLAELLNKMGARIKGAGEETIYIEGVESLGGAEHTIIPDRIETGTFIVAAALTGGELEIKDCRPDHLTSVISKLRETGVQLQELNPTTLLVSSDGLQRERCDHCSVSRISNRHAGSIHGPDDAGTRHIDDCGNSF